MKKIVFIVLLFACVALNAQEPPQLVRNGYFLEYNQDGQYMRLTQDVVDEDFWKKYSNASDMAYWGEYTWCFGLGWVLGAAIYQGIFYRDMFWENMKSNLCLGALCVVAGVPLHII